MALSMDVELFGVAVPNVYHRVTGVQQQRLGERNLVEYTLYKDSSATQLFEIRTRAFPYENINGDVAAWAYTQLKTLPEFAGAVDV